MKRTLIFSVIALIAIGSAATLLAQTPEEPTPPAGSNAPAPDNPPCMMGGWMRGPMAGRTGGMMPGMMGEWRDWGGRGFGGLLNCKALELTDDQIAKIKDLNFAHRNRMIDLQAALEKAQLKMRNEWSADTPNKTTILAAVKEVNAARGQIAEERVNHQFALRGVLTADQLKKRDDCRGNSGGWHGAGMGRGHGQGRASGQGRGFGRGNMQRNRDGSCVTGK
jgi:Spy/CpxP family protein refolding chaperone